MRPMDRIWIGQVLEDVNHRRMPDQGLWWGAVSVLAVTSVYVALAQVFWGVAMAVALAATVILLNHQRIAAKGNQRAVFTSLALGVVFGLALIFLHFVVGPAIRS